MPINNRMAAGIFEALQNALGTYHTLRQQKLEEGRMEERDRLARMAEARALRAQELDERTYGQRERQLGMEMAEKERLALQSLFERYPNAPVDASLRGRAAAAGMQTGIEDVMTLPSRSQTGYTRPGLPSVIADRIASPAQPTGESRIRPTASERYRQALETANLRRAGVAETNQTRQSIAAAQVAQRYEALRQTGMFRQASNDLKSRGLDISEDALAMQYARTYANLSLQQFMERARIERTDPFALMRRMQGEGTTLTVPDAAGIFGGLAHPDAGDGDIDIIPVF